MPKNPLLRLGIYVVLACGLLWLGGKVLFALLNIFFWIGIGGVVMIALGVLMEYMKGRKSIATATAPVPGAMASTVKAPSYLDDISEAERRAAENQLP